MSLSRRKIIEFPRLSVSMGKLHRVRGLSGRLKLMRALHEKGLTDPDVRGFAIQAVAGCPERDDRCEIETIFETFKRFFRYTGDIEGRDTFASAKRTLEWGGGDCDDATVGLTTLLRHLGFVTGAKVSITGDASDWNHVYAIVGYPKEVPTGYVALDPTVWGTVPGWEAPHSRSRIFQW